MSGNFEPGGSYNYPGSAGDPFGGNPTTGPTDAPVTSNGPPSSGSVGGSTPPSSNSGEGGGTDAGTGGTDSAAAGGDTTSSTSPASSDTGISNGDAVAAQGGIASGQEQNQDGSVGYGGVAGGDGPYGGGNEPNPSISDGLNLSQGGTSVGGYGNADYSNLRDALGIGGAYAPGMDSNFDTAMTDPLASVDTATWGGQYPTQTNDSLASMKTATANPERMPVGGLADYLSPGLSAPKDQAQVPSAPDSIYGGPSYSQPDYTPPQNVTDIATLGSLNSLYDSLDPATGGEEVVSKGEWDAEPQITAQASYDPLASISAALGIGTPTPQAAAMQGPPAMQGPSNDIPQPETPLAALRTALGVPTNTGVYPSRGDYQGMPYAGQAMVGATPTGPGASEMAQNLPGPDPRALAGAYPSRGTMDPNLPAFAGTPETVPDNVRPPSSRAFAAADRLPDLRNYAGQPSWNPPAQATQAATLGSINAAYESPQYGKEEKVAVNWDDPNQTPDETQQTAENDPLPNTDVGDGDIKRNVDPKQQDDGKRTGLKGGTRMADNAGDKGAREQDEARKKRLAEEQQVADLEEQLAALKARMAAKRAAQQRRLIAKTFA